MPAFIRPEVTFQDVIKNLEDGEWVNSFANEFPVMQTLAADLPAVASSHTLEDRGTFIEPYRLNKLSALSNIDKGGKYGKIDFYKRNDIMGMREAWTKVPQKQRMIDPNIDNYLDVLTTQTVQAMGLDFEHDLFYGNPAQDSDQILGLTPRFNKITDVDGRAGGKIYPYVTIDGGGVATGKGTGHLTSLWLIVPDANVGASIIYPKHVAGGHAVQMNAYPNQVEKTAKGDVVYDKKQFMVYGGLAIKMRRSVVRIANVDITTPEGLKAMTEALHRAFFVIPSNLRGRAMVYCNEKLIPELEIYYENRVTPMTYADAKPVNFGNDKVYMGQYLLRPTHQILTTESTVA